MLLFFGVGLFVGMMNVLVGGGLFVMLFVFMFVGVLLVFVNVLSMVVLLFGVVILVWVYCVDYCGFG